MFLIRRARIEDAPTLLKLARMVHFINLPADKDIIAAKVLHSRNCFIRTAGGDSGTSPAARRELDSTLPGYGAALASSDLFMFALEDTESGAMLGTSQIIAHMGGPGNPIVSLRLSRREFFSQSLQMGMTHVVARLAMDESGPSEIGGLILQPSYRRHKERLGRFLSLIRFHFVGLHRDLFADEIVAEMMAPITADGQNLLWDYLGRRFINLSYTEADRFCQTSREFMTSLLPRDDIYLTLLPPEARALVGEVGPETRPALRLLEQLGFRRTDCVDPFDGGPYLRAKTSEIAIVKDTRFTTLTGTADRARCDRGGYVSVLNVDGEFRAVQSPFAEADGGIVLPPESMELLGAETGARVGLTPVPSRRPKRDADGGAP